LIIRHGRFRAAESVCEELLDLSRHVGSVVGTADAHVYGAHALIARGEFRAAQAKLDTARDVIAKLGPVHRLRTGLGLAEFSLAFFAGDEPERWITDVATSRTPPWMTPITLGINAVAAACRGDSRVAEQHIDVLSRVLEVLDPTTVNKNAATSLAAEAVWRLGRTTSAKTLCEHAQAVIAAGVGDYTLTSNELTVARMAALAGDPELAGEHFERARRILDTEARRPMRAIVDLDEGRVTRSPTLIRNAAAMFQELGMTRWLREAETALGVLPEERPAGLTQREIEVLRLLAGGRTNKELAGDLVLSVHTIERHLANAYRKIGARNRADATAFVLRERL
jgi:DNA-binding NarL/FixJ family response regulator